MPDRARPWSKFFWSDWESDVALRQCSLAAQGLWMRILCICARAEPRGYLMINGVTLDVAAVATAVSRPETEVAPLMHELEHWGVFSRDRKRRIYSRRMVRDEKRSSVGRKAKKDALSQTGQADEKDRENPRPSRSPTRGASPHIPEARSQIPRKTKHPPPSPQGERELDGDLFCQAEEPPPPRQTEASGASTSSTEFEGWYAVYPRKVGRRQAEKTYRKARHGVSAERLLAGAKAYAALCRAKETEPQYIAHPATWLNGQRWTDEDLQEVSADPDPVDRRAFQRAVREWEDSGSQGPAPAPDDFRRSSDDTAQTEDSHDTLR